MPETRWIMLSLIFLARISMAMQFQSIAPLASLVVTDLGISYAQLGLLIGIYLLPGMIIALPGGLLSQRFGNRRVTLWGLGLMVGGGLATAVSHTLWVACAGRTVSGTGGVLLTLALTKMTAEWFAGKEITTAMSVMLTGWPVGIGLGTASFGALAAAASWRSAQHVAVASTAVGFVLLALCYRDAPDVRTSGGALRLWPDLPARGWAVGLGAGVVWMLFNVGFIVLVGFGPAFLVSRGTSLAHAGFLVSLAVWVSAISVPLGGALTDRTGRGNVAIASSCLITALVVAVVPLVPGATVWFLLAGLMMGPAPGAIVALVPASVQPKDLAGAYGLFYATYYLGMAAMQPVAGLVRDLTGSPAAPVSFAAAAMASTAMALGVFRSIERHTSNLPSK